MGPWAAYNPWDPRQRLVDRAQAVYEAFDLITLVTVPVIPILAYIVARLWRRAALSNECLACGYSLHGLPTSTCPECGVAARAHVDRL